ncbi:acetyltransferase [Undibacterium sp. RTI2.1]|uniref:acetyltransferase n=1 Tax=unclassified Undibacterium TaxID=2630295 RepID=UPI002AB3ACB7|nr:MULTISPECIES: acetyltransferase [unclassified Undibacterium]MDY7537137.1 acetyltransferase [Undibacterium sp. 5I1]MEB0029824.1 acetyltransferase [Undibacterium sp. RTI2.1]MEB0115109.1 acetyltransferase [Undibacterium sp. RTI2.2]MEB0229315.1 acetyltransferase [Undibacterium sp. 10I3]MEB0256137.1 acetyltransferase [Undibacterium sp. 5I1]
MKTIIYGNGAIAKLVFSYARHSMNIAGFTVDDICIADNTDSFLGLPLVPFTRVEEQFAPDHYNMIMAMGFVDMNALREKKYLEAIHKGYVFTSFIHASVTKHDDVIIEDNCVILDHVSIHPGCRIKQGTFISSNVNIGHDCNVDEFNWINSGVAIAGGCRIGQACFFGVNSSVGHGVHIGARNFIAANTLINKSTENDQVYLSEAGQLLKLKSQSFLKFSQLLG